MPDIKVFQQSVYFLTMKMKLILLFNNIDISRNKKLNVLNGVCNFSEVGNACQ